MKELKGRTGLAITDHPSLVEFLSRPSILSTALTQWLSEPEPVIVTDLDDDHEIRPAQHVLGDTLIGKAPLWCLLLLNGPIVMMLMAMLRGGDDEQRAFVCAKATEREQNYTRIKNRDRLIDFPRSPYLEEKTRELVHSWLICES